MVTIYGQESCIYCIKAKELCESLGLSYQYKTVNDKEVLAEMLEIAPGSKTVPQIVWNGKHIGGYTELVTEIENTREFGQGSF